MTLADTVKQNSEEKLRKKWGDERLDQILTHITENNTRPIAFRFPNDYFNYGRHGNKQNAIDAIRKDLDLLGDSLPDSHTYNASFSVGHAGLDAQITLDIYRKRRRRRY
jgi:hypothetical protein